jgi:hypothetical protein
LNQFVAAAVAEKVGVIETAREFLEWRAGSAKPKTADPRRNRARLRWPGPVDPVLYRFVCVR